MAKKHRRWPYLLVLGALLGTAVLVGNAPTASAGAGDVVLNPGSATLTVDGGGFFNVAGQSINVPSTATPPQCNNGTNDDTAVDDATAQQDLNIDFDGGASHGVSPATPVDAQCQAGGGFTSAQDDSEVKTGNQPRQYITMAGSVDKDGNISIPQAGITFPKFYVFSNVGGVIDIIPSATAAATGTLDPASGKSTLHVDWQLEVFQSFFNIDCAAQISMDLSTDASDPANSGALAVSPVGYSTADGSVTITGNTFTVGAMNRVGVITGTTGQTTAGSTTFVDPNANFTAGDVNKTMNIAGADTGGATLVAGIQSVTNSTTVVLKKPAVLSVNPASYDYARSVQGLCDTVGNSFGLPAASGASAAQLTAHSSTVFQSGQTPRIYGTVTEAGTGTPVPGTLVSLYNDYPSFTVASSTRADGSGNYHFYQVPPGNYRLRYWDINHQQVWYGGTLTYKTGTSFAVVSGDSQQKDIALPVKTGGEIGGKAVTVSNVGIPNILVQVFHETDGYVTQRFTNANGLYVVSGLPAGNYYVRFYDPSGTYATQWWNFKASGFKADKAAVGTTLFQAYAILS